MSYEDVGSVSQTDHRNFFSMSVSSTFLRKQRKLVAVFVIMAVLGLSRSSSLFKAAVKEDGYNDPEIVAREVLGLLVMDCQSANPKTFFIDGGPAGLPASRLGFQLKDGSQVAYYENDGGLYRERNGESQKVFDGLLSAFFRLPSRSNRLLLAELQIWNSKEIGDCSPSVIQKYIDVKPVIIATKVGKTKFSQRARSRRA